MKSSLELDHIVLATRDLERTSAWLSDVAGVVPGPGGPHVDRGTRNQLVALGSGAYLELIGPDPAQSEPTAPRPFGIDALTSPGVVAWCARTTDMAGFLDALAGEEPHYTPPVAMSRQAPGGLLSWTLTLPATDNPGGVVPFVIDWGDTPHPADTTEAALSLLDVAVVHPDPPALAATFERLGVSIDLVAGRWPGVRVIVRGPAGEVVLPRGRVG